MGIRNGFEELREGYTESVSCKSSKKIMKLLIQNFFASYKVGAVLSHLFVAIGVATVIFLVPAIRYAPIVEPVVTDVDPVSFYAEYKNDPDKYIFIDVRSADAYNKLHAEGSKLQPLHTLYTERHFLPRNDSNKTIVLICSGGLASGVGFSYLQHYGFRNILRIEGGIEAWQTNKLPVVGTDVLTPKSSL